MFNKSQLEVTYATSVGAVFIYLFDNVCTVIVEPIIVAAIYLATVLSKVNDRLVNKTL